MGDRPDVKDLSDDRLLRGLFEILKQTRHCEADLIAHIAEVDARRLWAREAAHSMFAYCTDVLHLSDRETGLRIQVARASRKHRVLLTMLRDGRIHLTGIRLLAPVLTRGNRKALLKRATHKSRRQIEEIVAEVAPRPDVKTTMRKLPARRPAPPGSAPSPQIAVPLAPVTSDGSTTSDTLQRPGAVTPVSACQVGTCGGEPDLSGPAGDSEAISETGRCPLGAPAAEQPALQFQPARPATVEPLSPARYSVRFTASAELHDKLEKLQVLMRRSLPDADLAAIIDVAVTEKLERLEAKRFGKTKKPRTRVGQVENRPKSRDIPAAMRRFVFKRDGGQCTYRDKNGRRCTKRHDLEFHHKNPFGKGGEHSPENLALMCKAHNTLLAEQDYGKEKMARHRRRARRDTKTVQVLEAGSGGGGLRGQWRSTG
jgi:5-methylcytosine-specific restriction endonuclease McrA